MSLRLLQKQIGQDGTSTSAGASARGRGSGSGRGGAGSWMGRKSNTVPLGRPAQDGFAEEAEDAGGGGASASGSTSRYTPKGKGKGGRGGAASSFVAGLGQAYPEDAVAEDVPAESAVSSKGGKSGGGRGRGADFARSQTAPVASAEAVPDDPERPASDATSMDAVVPGLTGVLRDSQLLVSHGAKALEWCEEQGATGLDEIAEVFEDFAEGLALKNLQRRRLERALSAALAGAGVDASSQRDPASPLSAQAAAEEAAAAEAARAAAAAAEQAEAERKASEEAQRIAAERAAALRAEEERQAAEKAAAEKAAAEEAAAAERAAAAKKAAEEKAAAEKAAAAERAAAAKRAAEERAAAEEKAAAEKAAAQQEAAARAAAEKAAAEKAAAERKAAEQVAKKAAAEKAAAESAAAKKAAAERAAAEKAAADRAAAERAAAEKEAAERAAAEKAAAEKAAKEAEAARAAEEESSGALAELRAAMEARDATALGAAISRADGAGVDAQEITVAKRFIFQLQKEKREELRKEKVRKDATAAVDAAAKGSDLKALQEAIGRAEEAGVDASALEAAKIRYEEMELEFMMQAAMVALQDAEHAIAAEDVDAATLAIKEAQEQGAHPEDVAAAEKKLEALRERLDPEGEARRRRIEQRKQKDSGKKWNFAGKSNNPIINDRFREHEAELEQRRMLAFRGRGRFRGAAEDEGEDQAEKEVKKQRAEMIKEKGAIPAAAKAGFAWGRSPKEENEAPRKLTLRAHREMGAGVDLHASWWGMFVDAIDDEPGQPGLRLKDTIVDVNGTSLTELEADDCEQRFADLFGDGSVVTVEPYVELAGFLTGANNVQRPSLQADLQRFSEDWGVEISFEEAGATNGGSIRILLEVST
eukprot:TRINITY_DN14399_c1_g1_i2.p1 TRINITY_DN14399_c1_g1~~TRINITY_DN14399_c1_g1_i2.p1  ORF type:complete len:877 (+),score=325.17 TRINITY_DN14399_c1_g1_i2:63-2693(+)